MTKNYTVKEIVNLNIRSKGTAGERRNAGSTEFAPYFYGNKLYYDDPVKDETSEVQINLDESLSNNVMFSAMNKTLMLLRKTGELYELKDGQAKLLDTQNDFKDLKTSFVKSSPDGFYFTDNKNNGDNQVFQYEINAKQLTQLKANNQPVVAKQIATSGSSLYYSLHISGSGSYVYHYDVSGSQEVFNGRGYYGSYHRLVHFKGEVYFSDGDSLNKVSGNSSVEILKGQTFSLFKSSEKLWTDLKLTGNKIPADLVGLGRYIINRHDFSTQFNNSIYYVDLGLNKLHADGTYETMTNSGVNGVGSSQDYLFVSVNSDRSPALWFKSKDGDFVPVGSGSNFTKGSNLKVVGDVVYIVASKGVMKGRAVFRFKFKD